MWAAAVIEVDVAAYLRSRLLDRLIGMQIDMLIFDRLPEPFHEDVVAPTSLAIHADGDTFFLEPPGEGLAGELAA